MASQAVVSAAGCPGEGVVCMASALPSVPSWGMPDSTPPGVMSHFSDHWQLAVLEVNGDTSEAPQKGFCLVFWVLFPCCTTSCLDNPAACHFLGRGLEEPCSGGFGAESIHKVSPARNIHPSFSCIPTRAAWSSFPPSHVHCRDQKPFHTLHSTDQKTLPLATEAS